MKFNYPKYQMKSEFTVGTFSENKWELGECACVDRAFYVLPDGEEFVFFKFCERTHTGRKRIRWEEWHNGKFSNNHFSGGFDAAVKSMECYMSFNGFSNNRQNYRVYQ